MLKQAQAVEGETVFLVMVSEIENTLVSERQSESLEALFSSVQKVVSINIRPYRHSYYQKNKIEKQVQKMLQDSIITLCHSPFSTLV